MAVDIYFSDFFEISPAALDQFGAFNVSLVSDLPLFVDPFLLFNSQKSEYRQLHSEIIRYVRFLRDRSMGKRLDDGLLRAWYCFSEVKQNWFGYSRGGNHGSGLGMKFARSLDDNLSTLFTNFGNEQITRDSHLEKLCLVSSGVGRDNISDFTTNLIKGFLLEYTQAFAIEHIDERLRKTRAVEKVRFNYETETWESATFDLPAYGNDFVLLTPKDLLTRDEIWISKSGLIGDFYQIVESVPNEQLRSQINNYFKSLLSEDPDQDERKQAIEAVIRRFPALLEYYIRDREDNGDRAVSFSASQVSETAELFVNQLAEFVATHLANTQFYEWGTDTYTEARARLLFLKRVIENNDGYRIFYLKGKPISREEDLQILYLLTWFATPSDVNRETNNGRGPVDFKISRGQKDKSLVEFKLASNSQLRRNLEKQVEVYKAANETENALKAIIYFTEGQLAKVESILKDLGLDRDRDIILIDARRDNKPSASKA